VSLCSRSCDAVDVTGSVAPGRVPEELSAAEWTCVHGSLVHLLRTQSESVLLAIGLTSSTFPPITLSSRSVVVCVKFITKVVGQS